MYLPFKVSLSSQPPAQREVGAGVFFVNQTGERCVHRKSHITPAPQNAVKYVRSEHALAREAASNSNNLGGMILSFLKDKCLCILFGG